MSKARPGDDATGRIFISYRREETAYPAGWLFDRLSDRFGAQQNLKDVDSIEPGDDFVQTITAAVGILALIGDDWLTLADRGGRRRLDDVNNFVRVEIEAALSRDVRVIPILVEGAAMPRAADLPPSLAGLVRRQALELSPSRFSTDLDRLVRVLERTLAEPPRRVAEPGPEAPAPAQAQAQAQERSSRPTNRLRALLSSRARIVAAVLVAVVIVLVVVSLASRGTSPSDGDSGDESPPSEASSLTVWPAPIRLP